MYNFLQKRISPIEYRVPQFQEHNFVGRLFELQTLQHYLAHLNFSCMVKFAIYMHMQITFKHYLVIKLYYYKIIHFAKMRKNQPILAKCRWRKQKRNKILEVLGQDRHAVWKFFGYVARKKTFIKRVKHVALTSSKQSKIKVLKSGQINKQYLIMQSVVRKVFNKSTQAWTKFRPRNLRIKQAKKQHHFQIVSQLYKRRYKRGISAFQFWPLMFAYLLRVHNYQQFYILKPLYALVIKNKTIRLEIKKYYQYTHYLLHVRYYYDFLFSIICMLNFYITNYILVLLVWGLQQQTKHKNFLWPFLTLLKKCYLFKLNILGIKLILKGPYNRHGRTQTMVYQVGGRTSLTNYNHCTLYDKIQCIGIYGMFTVRLWIVNQSN